MESPGAYSESLDQDDIVYPCKGCGDILEEGKAFELAGNRWHIDCFKCNTCGDPLDSDANLLLLGDGSLICNKCTYSCNACNNKIEDLAILTGDQAFCANCFRCRNCKRKIENLRYARTSQGIFCMTCHESLMARRRKKSRQKQQAASANGSERVVLDKSLPALPPSAVPSSLLSPDLDTPSELPADSPRNLSPMTTHSGSRKDRSPSNLYREQSPGPNNDHRGNLTLPSTTYGREQNASSHHDGGDDMFIQINLDPNDAPDNSPMVKSRTNDGEASAGASDPQSQRDYFNAARPQAPHRDVLRENTDSRGSSIDRERPGKPSPHIAYQAKECRPSEAPTETIRKKPVGSPPTASADFSINQTRSPQPAAQSANRVEPSQNENFKLQEVPQDRKAGSRSASRSDIQMSGRSSPPSDVSNRAKSPQAESIVSSGGEDMAFYPPTSTLDRPVDRPRRGDSLQKQHSLKKNGTPSAPSPSPATPTMSTHERKSSSSSILNRKNGGATISSPIESPTQKNMHDMAIPPRNTSRPTHPGIGPSQNSYTAPRAPPQPPVVPGHHKGSESVTTVHSDNGQGGAPPGLPRYSGGPGFSLDDEIGRIMENGEGDEKESVLRRVSNAMHKHQRSASDRGSRSSAAHSHRHRPTNGSVDISSPTTTFPEGKEDVAGLRNDLRRANQKIAEMEAEKLMLAEKLNTTPDLKQANTELREKRSTMAILDTQREMLIRELEIMTDHLAKAKDSSKPISTATLKSNIYEEFSQSLQKLKDTLGLQIESQMQQRQELTAEISTLIQMKDKGFQEYESLSSKNQQLLEMNHSLVNGIQDVYKANKGPNAKISMDGQRPPPDALGIYRGPKDSKSEISRDDRSFTETSSTNLMHDIDPDQTVIAMPKVIDVKKKGKLTNWKKGGSSAAKTLTKNLKTAFASSQSTPRDEPYSLISSPYSTTGPSQHEPIHTSGPVQARAGNVNQPGFGFFGGNTHGHPKQGQNLTAGKLQGMQNNSNTDLPVSEPAHVLFGSDLTERCVHEKRNIPFIVSRCIQEVQVRGMDLEGIYRKSGSNSAVVNIRGGFENNTEYDISDPDLDITAVTSVLKQYFRKLPNPLISFDVYDKFLLAGVLEDREKRVLELRQVLGELPKAHFECLQFLVFHLAQVTTKLETKMTALNLAVVFAPTIMRPTTIEREMADMQSQKLSVMHMIEDVKDVFSEVA